MEESPHNLAQHSARGFIGRHRVRARWSVALAILLVLPIWGAVSIGTTATRSHIAGGLMDTVSHQRMLGQDVAWHARLLAERPDDAARRARLARAIADLQESSADLGQRLSEAPASTRFMIRPTQHAEIDDACRQLLEAADAIAMLSTGQHAENLFASRDASSGALEEAGRMHFEATAGFIAEMRAAQRVRSTAAVDRLRLLLMLELVLAGIAILLVIEPTVRWMRRREAAWEDQQAQLEYFFANSLDVLCICDQKGRLMKVNQAWTDLVGIDPEKLKGRNFVEFVHPEDTDRTLRELEKLIEVGECDDFRNRYRTQAGSWRTIEWRGTARGGLIFAAARDISDRLEMEHALALQAERMELALAAGDVGTWDWKVATDMLSVDERWAAMIGESPAEVGNTVDAWASRVHPTDLPMCLDRLDKCFKDNVSYKDVLFRMRHRDGSWRWIQASGSKTSAANQTNA